MADTTSAGETAPTPDPRSVFVVHGRNEPLRKAIFDLLRSLDLKPIEWNHAVELTGTGTPYIGQVLDAAFEHAQAVVVLMTPDEVAYLQPRYGGGDHDPETQPSAQARPNVLFEAGMALGRNPNRTVLVEVGTVRPFSDIAGRHTVRLTNDPGSRQTLAGRLKTAGCPVDLKGTDWQSTGDFTSPGAPGDGLPLGRRVPSNTQSRPAVAFDAHYRSSGKSGGRLQVINRGTEAAYDVTVDIPDGASLEFIEDSTIEKIPGGGKSVTLLTIDRFGNTLGGTRGKRAFDLTITARTESGDRIVEDVFLDMNG